MPKVEADGQRFQAVDSIMKPSTIQIQEKLDAYELQLQLSMSQLTKLQLNPKGGHFLKDNITCFDNTFFRISDKEASVSNYCHTYCVDFKYFYPFSKYKTHSIVSD